MYFDYRIVRKFQRYGKRNENQVTSYQIHEATYDNNGKIVFISEDPIYPCGENVEDMMINWLCMIEAFSKPIVDFDSVPEKGAVNPMEEIIEEIKENSKNSETYGKPIDQYMEERGIKRENLQELRGRREEERKVKELQYQREFVDKPFEEVLEKILEFTEGWF
jgi:hypothetical protein